MAQLINLPILISCISLLQFTVLSQPVSSSVSTSGGSGLAGQLTSGAGVSGTTASDVDAAAEVATTATGELAADASTLANNLAEGAKDIGEAVGQISTIPLTAGQGMWQLGTGKLTAGTNAVLGAGRFGTQLGTSFLNGAGNGFGFAGTGSRVPSIEAIQRQMGPLSPMQWQVIDRAMRDGALGVVDVADQTSGQMNAYARPVFTGGARVIDNGLGMMGFRQPVVTPIAEATWQAGENGRQSGFDFNRNLINGEYQLPYFLSPSNYLNGGASGNAEGTGLFGLEIPTSSVTAEVGATSV